MLNILVVRKEQFLTWNLHINRMSQLQYQEEMFTRGEDNLFLCLFNMLQAQTCCHFNMWTQTYHVEDFISFVYVVDFRYLVHWHHVHWK
jgi:hypothetical protein